MKIIGIVGLIGSGKDTAEEYISEKYGYKSISMGDVLREIAASEGCGMDRDSLQNLRVKKGRTFLAEEVAQRISDSGWGRVIISGIRMPEDYEIPRKRFGGCIKLIHVEASRKKRFERLAKRGTERDPKSIDEFRRNEKREKEIYDFGKTFSHADYVLDNNGSMEDLKRRADKIMAEIEK